MQDFRIQKIFPVFLFSALILFIFLVVLKIPLILSRFFMVAIMRYNFYPGYELNTNLQRGIYPFFSFEINFGQDILQSPNKQQHIQLSWLFIFWSRTVVNQQSFCSNAFNNFIFWSFLIFKE